MPHKLRATATSLAFHRYVGYNKTQKTSELAHRDSAKFHKNNNTTSSPDSAVKLKPKVNTKKSGMMPGTMEVISYSIDPNKQLLLLPMVNSQKVLKVWLEEKLKHHVGYIRNQILKIAAIVSLK